MFNLEQIDPKKSQITFGTIRPAEEDSLAGRQTSKLDEYRSDAEARQRAVAIYQMMQRASYSPEEIERLTAAYKGALLLLKLANRTDPINQIVAKRIIDAAKTGIRDPEELCAWAIRDLMIP
ncbi:MAG: hypothetical protein WBF03_04730 [Xanthobacteraceae bacterium]